LSGRFVAAFVFAAMSFAAAAPSAAALAPPPPDRDGDGVPNPEDSCPNQPGPASNNGCPIIPPPPPPDGDGDGVPDAEDSCPNQPGPASNSGCPIISPPPDGDGDGVPDAEDSCPSQPGPASNNGCPILPAPPDGDGDSVPDAEDSCPSQPGPASNNGCPTIPPPPPPPPPIAGRSLALDLPDKLKVGGLAVVEVEGFANAGDELALFVDPEGRACPSSASARPANAISLVESEVAFDSFFQLEADYTPERPGLRTFCAYLGPSSEQADVQANAERNVIQRRLRGSVARRAVVTALKRHGFARRVVKSVERNCRRRARNEFSCEFSSAFPGYRLKGRGRVRLGFDLSYRFRVKAQGVRFTLTEINEERRSN
jgi:hypothetical protein